MQSCKPPAVFSLRSVVRLPNLSLPLQSPSPFVLLLLHHRASYDPVCPRGTYSISSLHGPTSSRLISPTPSSPWIPKKWKRFASSRRWTDRQGKDQFARAAKVQGLKSRAAFKLLQINDRYKLFKPGMTVVDLGFAPGSWSQVGNKPKIPPPSILEKFPCVPGPNQNPTCFFNTAIGRSRLDKTTRPSPGSRPHPRPTTKRRINHPRKLPLARYPSRH